MPKRLRVLMSAYACEPGKGSEPEVGWQWAMWMARRHEVTVLTRANNRPAIEEGLARLPADAARPAFVYHELGARWLRLKRRFTAPRTYYAAWQRSARAVVARLVAGGAFDLLHHVTFATFRFPTAIWGHGLPTVWGPIGGLESIPASLLHWRQPATVAAELARNFSNALQASPLGVLARRSRASTLTLAANREMLDGLARCGAAARMLPTIGIVEELLADVPPVAHAGPFRLLFAGQLVPLKGIDLMLEALAQSGTRATLTLIGAGGFAGEARRLAAKLGLTDRVTFAGQLPRADTLRAVARHDAFLFAGMRDSGALAVIEAMAAGLPVICLDCGGPAVSVREGCGVRVPLGARAAVVAGLAAAIARYEGDRELCGAHGTAAQQLAAAEFIWPAKAEKMDAVYHEAMGRWAR